MKKRILSTILVAALMFGALGGMFTVDAGAASKWSGYTKISKPEDLLKMKDSTKKFYLSKNIDLSEYGNWQPINFLGTLDGDGYAIRNLKSSGDKTAGGLFSRLELATVKNLGLVSVTVSVKVGGGTGSRKGVGGLASEASESTIENCYITGQVSGYSEANTSVYFDWGLQSVGGLVGHIDDKVTFKNCVNLASVNLSGGQSRKKSYAGGIVGNGYSSVLTNCLNAGKVSFAPRGSNDAATAKIVGYVGGIAGYLDGTATSCHNTGKVTAASGENATAGDLIGYGGMNTVTKDCVYNGKNSFVGASDDGFAGKASKKSSSTMKKQATYKGFDFKKIWFSDAKINSGYPILQNMLSNYNASRPTANKKAGSYSKNTEITLSTNLSGVTIRYTTNGKDPTTSSTKYSKAIKLTKNTKIKAAVFTNNGKIRGKVVTLDYKVK
ncbi:MAG: chitobiase/beta-hexosaminidase C-terminal domain-containing protein [Oscillospiraceae bacterium]|jgi:hypothetical protein|nr:chitobiase/beta-hexosaminidase C-terminal domain-containing protein [Oscillospiraceae bacterium]